MPTLLCFEDTDSLQFVEQGGRPWIDDLLSANIPEQSSV
jgi:hypothetical protein